MSISFRIGNMKPGKNRAKKLISLYLILALLVSFGYWRTTQAAALTVLSDTMTRLKASQASDHDIRFTTPTGATDASDTIEITFPSGFDVSGVDYTDIDLHWGPSTGLENSATLDSAADATHWGCYFTSQVLSFDHATDGTFEDIAAASKIVIEIGSNATGGGSNAQIDNPTAGTKVIEIGGDFGDSGKIAVAIISEDQVTVSATIDPYLTFSVTNTSITLSATNYTTTGYNSQNTLAANTNAASGYNITYSGSTLTSGGNTITAMAAKAASSIGNEQFGINLKDNATPNTGTDPSGSGSGAPASDYNTADQFKFIADTVTTLASASAATASNTFTVSYIANVSATTEAGIYSTTITYICTGNF